MRLRDSCNFSASFFKETAQTLLIAFILMAIVVFIYFRILIPSAAIILSIFSDMVITLAIFNLLGFKLSTAGIAAFLMVVGYSVDNNILLSTKMLKSREGTLEQSIIGAIKTGLMMSSTPFVASLVALIFTQSDVIRQIMLILFISLVVDVVNTWIQNVGLLRLYLERKNVKN